MNTLPIVRKPTHTKCYGLELECLVNGIYLNDKKYSNMFYIGHDSSILRDYGYEQGVEFVSQPLPYGWLLKEIDKLSKAYNWRWNTSCGIHIHVSKKAISPKTIEKLINFFEYDYAPALALRSCFGRVWNHYCTPSHGRYDRCFPINSRNQHTYEFRMFSSGDANWAKECMRRVRLMCEHKGEFSWQILEELFNSNKYK